MPPWFVEAVRADDWREPNSPAMVQRPYSEVAKGRSAFTENPSRQPSGALSGKVVFLLGGHGWTYSYTQQAWYTQRGVTHGVVEDFGNKDQANFFAHYLWNAGATVVPLRPVDVQRVERVMDNSSIGVEFFGPWSSSDSTIHFAAPNNKGPAYRFATASLEEKAVARYTPNIPKAGDYPVYSWVRDGADRITQLYRIAHSGGVTEVLVNHRLFGKGWVWLGTFYFDQGTAGYVEISNKVSDPYTADDKHVAVADAVRFGNGMGDINRGGGISGQPREDEGDCYWIERSLGPTADRRIYTAGDDDGAATVGAPPKSSAYMNRETEGNYFDRIYLSFHSNALNGKARGAMGLFNKVPAQRPAYQQQLATIIGEQINDEMATAPATASPAWVNRRPATSNWITFGELRKDYIQNEMCATILEVAFHDNAEDARLMLDPRSRQSMARATLRGLLNWYEGVNPSASNLVLLPTAPDSAAAQDLGNGKVRISWKPGSSERMKGDPPLGYRVSSSANGRGFAKAAEVFDVNEAILDKVSTATATYFKITAFNSGGESFPTELLAVRPSAEETLPLRPSNGKSKPMARKSAKKEILVVNGFNSLDASMNVQEEASAGLGSGRGPGGTYWRVRPNQSNSFNYVLQAADALTLLGKSFDTANVARLSAADINLGDYKTVIWMAGGQLPKDGVVTSTSQRLLSDFVRRGGNLFMSGSHIAEALDGRTTAPIPSKMDRQFLNQTMGCSYVTSTSIARKVSGVPATPLAGISSVQLDDANSGTYDALPCDVIAPPRNNANARSLLVFDDIGNGAAAVACAPPNSGKVVTMSFPFETITPINQRREILAGVLAFFESQQPDFRGRR
ncbi:MAG: N-acetylmuramoyl-L-alanine amidase [Candidatus Sumerlaeaceae bacterium]|nr:N-acetylmuramoyl-L-alanine amidase [Candidatus Sumerlaeaceae bacterium]